MVSYCANPACGIPFHNVHLGKLFLIENREETSASELPMFTPVRRHVRYVWLCESCAKAMHVVRDAAGHISVEPLPEVEMNRRAEAIPA